MAPRHKLKAGSGSLIIRPYEKSPKMKHQIKLIWLIAAVIGVFTPSATAASSPWQEAAADLAAQIASILGPGQAHLTIRNLSAIPTDEIPTIRRLLEQNLKSHSVTASGADSASAIRVTLSENAHNRIWVAEIVEGSETQIAIVDLGPDETPAASPATGLILRRQELLSTREPILAALELPNALIALETEQIVVYAQAAGLWREQQRAPITVLRPQSRDRRGVLIGSANGSTFEAWLPGIRCASSIDPTSQPASWKIQCRATDDPWAVTQPPLDVSSSQPGSASGTVSPIRAFYNATRNYFTGVISPDLGVDLLPFYTLAQLPRPSSTAALLINGIDGKVQLAENGALKFVSGTRDWGSDFAILHSPCGTGVQIVTSSSGEAQSDSLRAYELPALEAIPASAPLAMDGAVTALATAQDLNGVFAVVRTANNRYEVDRVTALCN
jgi:hypothetical protein